MRNLTSTSRALFLFFLVIAGFTQHQTAGQTIDQSFNVSISTSSFTPKAVDHLLALPDGKILAGGTFNNYNGANVGGLVRLNADGTLDQSFNNLAFPPSSGIIGMRLANDGTIYVRVHPSDFLRLEPDGTIDPTFNYDLTGNIGTDVMAVDSQNRLIIGGYFQVERNGQTVTEHLIRLNLDGSLDLSFDAPPIESLMGGLIVVGDKIYATRLATNHYRLLRFSSTGQMELDAGPITTSHLTQLAAQSDGKILVKTSTQLRRVTADGVIDASFQEFSFGPNNNPRQLFVDQTDRITVGYRLATPDIRYVRLDPNGSPDASFTPFVYLNDELPSATLTADNSLIIGDHSSSSDANRFMRVLTTGAVDSAFNAGGSGFLSYAPGIIRAILPLPDNKLLIGGNFQRVNGSVANRIARLNADGTLDPTFQLTTGSTGNVFSNLSDIYTLTLQPDGKLLISGDLRYSINSVTKLHVVRVDQNGNIDPTFNLGILITDYFGVSGWSKDKMLIDSNNRILVGSSGGTPAEVLRVPLRLNQNGSLDTSFSNSAFSSNLGATAMDIHLYSSGKILISGLKVATSNVYGYLMRLNPDGSVDTTFQPFEVLNYRIVAFKVLPNGKVLALSTYGSSSRVLAFNADGTTDNSFFTGTGSNGKLNSIEALENGKVLIGGSFSTYNGQPRKNFAVLDSAGQLTDDRIEPNGEVHCITVDATGRILIGGVFTAIIEGTQSFSRTYLARLSSSLAGTPGVLFDYDGDGRADLSVRRPSNNVWHLLRATAGYTAMQFGQDGDRMAPADYDGDGKTDVAVFRPSNGTWYMYMSLSQTFQAFGWGQAGDLPVPTDRDADGRIDLVIYRESNNTWYTRFANGTFAETQFGVAGDRPVVGDFDADGKGDIAVFRPSNNNWYIIKSSLGFFIQTWGESGDLPLTGDFDGDGATDQAVFRPSTGQWYMSQTTAGFSVRNWGENGDVPVAADYDGDGRTDVAVFRPSIGTWYIVNSTAGILVQQFGQTGDLPTQSAFNY